MYNMYVGGNKASCLDLYGVVPRYSLWLFLAKTYSNSLDWLEMSTQLMQPTCHLYCKEAKYHKGTSINDVQNSPKYWTL